MGRKLRSESGETLVEALASILICSLSVLMLFYSVGTTVNLGAGARGSDEAYYEALSAAEKQDDPLESAQIAITGAGMIKKIDVGVYGGEGMYSYAAAPVAGP